MRRRQHKRSGFRTWTGELSGLGSVQTKPNQRTKEEHEDRVRLCEWPGSCGSFKGDPLPIQEHSQSTIRSNVSACSTSPTLTKPQKEAASRTSIKSPTFRHSKPAKRHANALLVEAETGKTVVRMIFPQHLLGSESGTGLISKSHEPCVATVFKTAPPTKGCPEASQEA